MNLIDTHCHLTVVPPAELPAVFARAAECSVTRMICIGASDGIASSKNAIDITNQYAHVWATVGIHPHDAKAFQTFDPLLSYLSHPKVVAIGECGLDFFKDWSPREDQERLFRNTIAVAKEHKKPLIIHCRDAREEIYKILKETNALEVGGVFHCYSEDSPFAEKLRDINFLVSFTGNITFKKSEALRETVRDIPLEQIMLETDMPYLAPEPFRGKPSEPKHVLAIAEKVAEIKGVGLDEVARVTSATAERFFGLK